MGDKPLFSRERADSLAPVAKRLMQRVPAIATADAEICRQIGPPQAEANEGA